MAPATRPRRIDMLTTAATTHRPAAASHATVYWPVSSRMMPAATDAAPAPNWWGRDLLPSRARSRAVVFACKASGMKFAAVLDLLIGAGLAWLTYEVRGAFASPDAWLAVGIGLLSALMLLSSAALAAGAAWGPRLGQASSRMGLVVGTAGLAVGVVLLIGGNYQDVGSGAAKGALGVGFLLVFAIAFWVNRSARRPVAA